MREDCVVLRVAATTCGDDLLENGCSPIVAVFNRVPGCAKPMIFGLSQAGK
jgi:hypothetical protein